MNIEYIFINRRDDKVTVEAVMSDGSSKIIPEEVVNQFMEIVNQI